MTLSPHPGEIRSGFCAAARSRAAGGKTALQVAVWLHGVSGNGWECLKMLGKKWCNQLQLDLASNASYARKIEITCML
jgi:hypothetical protein